MCNKFTYHGDAFVVVVVVEEMKFVLLSTDSSFILFDILYMHFFSVQFSDSEDEDRVEL